VRDWTAYVRAHLALHGVDPAREARVIRELAVQLEDFYREARARGDADPAADAYARAQIQDWPRMADDVRRAGPVAPALDRVVDRIDDAPATRRTRSLLMIAHALRDGRYAIRQLRRAPAFTTVAVLTLALGIGATSAIFSVVNAVLLRPLPYADPASLVRIHEVVPQYGRFAVAPASFLDWRRQAASFERIAAYSSTSATFMHADGPERVPGAAVSWDLLTLLGIAPAIGASFSAAQDAPGAGTVIVLSHGFWQRRYGGDAAIVGRAVSVNGVPATVIGVMPEGFYFPSRTAEFWQPLALDSANASRGAHYLGVVARLKPGVEAAAAAAEMKTIAERLAGQYPETSANESAEVVSLHEQVVGTARPALLTLLAAVIVVVLIACANVANLLLVRAALRAREVAIRTALGAARARLTMQMLVESVMLAVAGGAAGLLLARLAIPWIQSMGGASVPRAADIGVDSTVLAFTAGIALLTGLLFGLAPAWQAGRMSAAGALKEGGRSSSTSARWVRTGLLVGEVALSVVLLVGAALFLRSFARLTQVDPGFVPEQVLAFQVALPATSYPTPAHRIQFFDRLHDQLVAVPSIRRAGAVQRLPLVGGYVLSFAIEGRPPPRPGDEPSANHRVVTPQYFETIGIPLRRGRLFTSHDAERGPLVAVIDEAFARRHFAADDPIGQRLDIGNGTDGAYEIVGVVGDVRTSGLDSLPAPTMYVPLKQDVFSTMWIVARGEGEAGGLVGDVRRVLREIDPALPAYAIQPLTAVISDSVADRRFSMQLLTLFAAVALFLATVGLYGVVAYSVSQRTREIGLRLAIGAGRGDIVRLVVGGGMRYAAAGVLIGGASAVALGRYVESMLYEVTSLDAVSYAGTAAVLLAVAALACYVPARRAMRVDPLVTLQSE
jgi:putative ABC transport system permease protein